MGADRGEIVPSPAMVRLSVNVNKVATLRNSRGGVVPSVTRAVETIITAGARGITAHPRADHRHITPTDVREIATVLARWRHEVEYNIEGDPRPDWVALVHDVRPHQCTLVPVRAGEITSQAGWAPSTPRAEIARLIDGFKGAGVRVSVFVDADLAAVAWAHSVGADRIELYTEPFARAFEHGTDAAAASVAAYARAAEAAHALGLGVNAGHDLDLENLTLFRTLPHLAEVSIGHALISHALDVGLMNAVRDYLAVVEGA